MEVRQVRLPDGRLSGPGAHVQALAEAGALAPDLVLVFASIAHFRDPAFVALLAETFPNARRVGCSTAGEISTAGVSSGGAVLTALRFANTRIRTASAPHASMATSHATGVALGRQLAAPDLRAILLYGTGVDINGSALIAGLAEVCGPDVPITGGLAGDDGAFQRTYTLLDDRVAHDQAVAIGLCGDAVRFSYGCFHGWEPFGVPRKVTNADANMLYELDGKPALDLYTNYLGEYAADLPGSGLLYPFEMLDARKSEVGLIRTILGVDPEKKSLTLAGDVGANGYLRLMHASSDALVEGAGAAGRAARAGADDAIAGGRALALLVSCVGRKLVLGERVDEEVEAVAESCGSHLPIAGFYSNGEISPLPGSTDCRLHNQTMSVTVIGEAA